LEFDLEDDDDGGGFVANNDEIVTFAVRPYSDQNITLPESLLLNQIAAKVFPVRNGSFEIKRHNFHYDQAIDHTTYVELTNVRPVAGETQNQISASATTDYVILTPRTRYIISTGQSGDVTYGDHMDYAAAIADFSLVRAEDRKPDIEFDKEADLPGVLSQVEENLNVLNVYNDAGNKYISITASAGSFGAVWFRDTRSIGGIRDFCNTGGCLFNNGFRAFFIFNFTGTNGDGFTFSAINRSNNDIGSVGGDIELSELLAYAGDSRLISAPTLPSDFKDGRSGEGLNPPKFAVEFDGFKNNQFTSICQDANNPNIGTRNDPDFFGANRDAVQYVFWGRDSSIFAPCRVNPLTGINKTYDDNRHDGVNAIWIYDSGSEILSSPAVDDTDPLDIRIYTGRSSENTQNDGGRLIRLRASDGAIEWSRNPDEPPNNLNDDDINSSPELDSSGNIYIGNDNNLISKYSPVGTKDASLFLDNDIEGKPAVSVDAGKPPVAQNTVYVVTDNGSLYALTKSLTLKWAVPFDIGAAVGTYTSWPVIRYDAALGKNIVYVGSLNSRLYAVRDDGASGVQLFSYLTGGAIRGTPAINPVSGDVYFGSDNGTIYAISKSGSDRWFTTPAPAAAIVSSPAVTSDGGVLYVGSNNGHMYALNTLNGNKLWEYPDPGRTPGDPARIGDVRSAPIIASDGAIIFGSDDGHLYALNPNGTLRWRYPSTGSAIGPVRSKPAIDLNGIIYFGAGDGKLYALDPSANDPPNIQNLYLTSAELGAIVSDPNNWFADGPWAVRVEVERSQTPNVSGNFEYTLKTWLKKCADANCLQEAATGLNVVGGFFQNTRFEYDWTTAGIIPMTQVIELSNTPDSFHDRFDRFLFGFTSASAASQTIEIRKFQLSFIRPNDPVQSD
jgi:outer membrane protein assembly factor BamB